MKDPITLKSGAVFTPALATFEDGWELMQIFARELLAVNFDISNLDWTKIGSQDINTLKNVVFQLVQSKPFFAILAKAMLRCLYNGQKIVPGTTFMDEDARGDFLPIVWEVIKINLPPFFKNLDLSFLTNELPPSESPESPASSTPPA